VQLENQREDFQELLEDLTRRMTRRGRCLRYRPDPILLGEIVAIRERKGWQRGIVTQLGEGDMVTIALRDWGRAIQRPYHDIYILEDRFRELEWQAIILRARSHPTSRNKNKVASKSQGINETAPRKTRGVDKDPRFNKR